MSAPLPANATLTQISLIAALLNHGQGSVADYLPLADAELPRLLDGEGVLGAPLDEAAIEASVDRLATQRCGDRYSANVAKFDAWMVKATADEADPVETLIGDRVQAAFALGMALGLRLVGGQR